MNDDIPRVAADLVRQTEDFVKDTVTYRMTRRVGVDVRKPRWMPAFVWRWMWRQVIVSEGPTLIERIS